MPTTKRHRYALIGTAILLSASCAVHDVREVPVPETLPESFSDTEGNVTPPDRWWKAFNSPELDRLIESALSENLDLKTAFSRLDQGWAMARIAASGLQPTLDANTSAWRGRTQNPFFGDETENQFSFGLTAAYEVDLWKKIASRRNAAELDVVASRQDLESAALILTSQVSSVWFSIIEQEAQRRLLSEQLESSETFLELVELRFGQGRASAVDVFQQRGQTASVRTQFPVVESRREVLQNQLAVLLGRSPTEETPIETEELPSPPPIPDIGLPIELLDRRPDILSARLRVGAADYRVASAIADRLPALRLSGNSNYGDSEVSDLFSNWLWNVAGNLMTPILDGGRRQAEVARTRAVVTERLHQYEKTVLVAIQEVENAVAQEREQRNYLKELHEQIEIARETLDSSQARYVNGQSDYLPVLTALQALQRLERNEVTDRLNLLLYRIDLYKALGGNWTRELSTSTPPEPSPVLGRESRIECALASAQEPTLQESTAQKPTCTRRCTCRRISSPPRLMGSQKVWDTDFNPLLYGSHVCLRQAMRHLPRSRGRKKNERVCSVFSPKRATLAWPSRGDSEGVDTSLPASRRLFANLSRLGETQRGLKTSLLVPRLLFAAGGPDCSSIRVAKPQEAGGICFALSPTVLQFPTHVRLYAGASTHTGVKE